MALDHGELEREIVGRGPEDRDQHPRRRPLGLDLGQVVMAHALALIDREGVAALGVDHVAERGEGFAGQRLGGQDAHQRNASFAWRLTSL
jgi:hypothetical protein